MKMIRSDESFFPPTGHRAALTITDAVWVAMASLHRENRERPSFAPSEIVVAVMEMGLTKGSANSIWTHVRLHSVGNKRPQPNTVCMLTDPGDGTRRLWRRGDVAYAGRNIARTHPDWTVLPTEYRDLQHWYELEWETQPDKGMEDGLMALAGTWTGERADAYVSRLRAGWEERG